MNDTTPHIVFAEPYSDAAVDRLRAVGRVTMIGTPGAPPLMDALADAEALLVRTATQVTAKLLERAPRLRVIGRGGVGLDNIDVASARARGVVVVYTPAAATGAVADLTLGLLLALVRDLAGLDRAVRDGDYRHARSGAMGRELSSLTLGVLGMGRIGRAVAERARLGFGMRVIYNDIVEPGRLDVVAEAVSKDDLYARSDVLSLHVPLTAETRGLIGSAVLGRCRPGALLINTARGAVVDNMALAAALSAGQLAGAGLDVTDPEPLPAGHPLLAAPGTVFTPHVGARTAAGQAGMNAVVEDVAAVLAGQPPRYPAP